MLTLQLGSFCLFFYIIAEQICRYYVQRKAIILDKTQNDQPTFINII